MLDKATMESEAPLFAGDGGFALHGINGQIVFPVLVLILFVLSFFAKVPRGVMWAGVALGLTVLQILFAVLGHGLPFLGVLHGVNALLIFGVAVMAAMAARGDGPGRRPDDRLRRGLSHRWRPGGSASARSSPSWPPWWCSGCRAGCGGRACCRRATP